MKRLTRSRGITAAVLFAAAWAAPAVAQTSAPATAPASKPPISNEELEQLVATIALYPDGVMTQVLMASTYPLEVVVADRYAKANKNLKGDALATDLEKQPWDPSVKSLVNFPTVLDMMSSKLEMTVKLGDAFIADQKRVLDAVQRLRAKAQGQGNLKTTEQQVVTVQPAPAGSSNPQVIVIEPAQSDVIYVPTYDPVVVYGSWPYPAYPPYYYYPPGYVAGAGLIGFGLGFACGVAWGYAWGNCNWGGGDIDIDVDRNNNFNTNIDRGKYKNQINSLDNRAGGLDNRAGGAGNAGNRASQWKHDPGHRDGVAYRDNATAQKFGGASTNQAIQARDSFRGRADQGRQDIARGGINQGNLGSSGLGGSGNLGAGNRGGSSLGGAGAGSRDVPGVANFGGSGTGQRGTGGSNLGSGGSVDFGSRPSAGNTANRSAFDGMGGGGAGAGAASQRGAASRNGSVGSSSSRLSGGGGASRPSGGGSRPSGGGRTGGGGGGRRR